MSNPWDLKPSWLQRHRQPRDNSPDSDYFARLPGKKVTLDPHVASNKGLGDTVNLAKNAQEDTRRLLGHSHLAPGYNTSSGVGRLSPGAIDIFRANEGLPPLGVRTIEGIDTPPNAYIGGMTVNADGKTEVRMTFKSHEEAKRFIENRKPPESAIERLDNKLRIWEKERE